MIINCIDNHKQLYSYIGHKKPEKCTTVLINYTYFQICERTLKKRESYIKESM